MRAKDNMRTAAEVLVDQLGIHGVRHVFCVPGESYLAVLDAFHDSDLAITVCRQEGGACMMAEAIGKVTGRPGVCFVTRGPGATNASPGIHIAHQDSTPLVMFVGQVARDMREREAFQELDYRAVFGSMTKWATEIDDPARVPEIVSRAFHTAANGRPGPVVVAIPEDMLIERIAVPDAPPFALIETSPGLAEMEKFAEMLAAARAPIMLLGGSRWSQAACDARRPVCAKIFAAGVPPRSAAAICSMRCIPATRAISASVPIRSSSSASRPPTWSSCSADGWANCRRRATRCSTFRGRRCRSFTCIRAPRSLAASTARIWRSMPRQRPSPRRWKISICPHPTLPRQRGRKGRAVRGQAEAAHADYLEWTEKPTEQPGAVNLGAVMVWLRENLPLDAIICNGAGNYAAWIHRFFRMRRFGQHVAPASGSMGYGVPAAVAMKRLYPDRAVVCIAGDGDFLMNGQEFATAVQYACLSPSSSPTTASTAPSACTRSANIPAASRRANCAIRIFALTPAPSAASAPPWRAPKIFPRRSRRRRRPASRRSSALPSTPKRSRRSRRFQRSARSRWRRRAGDFIRPRVAKRSGGGGPPARAVRRGAGLDAAQAFRLFLRHRNS